MPTQPLPMLDPDPAPTAVQDKRQAPAGRWPRPNLPALAAAAAVALWLGGLLWHVLMGPGGGVGLFDAQECQVGVLAWRIHDRGLWAIWEWTGPSGASWEALLAAAGITLWSADAAVLRMVPLVLYAMSSLTVLWMMGRWLGWPSAAAGALVMAVSFPGTLEAGVRAWGGLPTAGFLGLLALGAASSLTVMQPRRLSFSTGLLCGLCVSAHPALVPVAAGALVAAVVGLSAALVYPARLLIAADHALRLGVGLAAGAVPLLGRGGWPELLPRMQMAVPDLSQGAWQALLAQQLGGPRMVTVLLGVLVLAVPGVLLRLMRHGIDHPGVRLGLGALTAALGGVVVLLLDPPSTAQALQTRLWPLVQLVPVLVALPMVSRGLGLLSAAAAAWMWWTVSPSPAPAERSLVPVEAAVAWLDAHPGTHCFASGGVAWRVALRSAERHPCVALDDAVSLPEWLEHSAAGPRAYFFGPWEHAGAQRLLTDLEGWGAAKPEAAGPFLVVTTHGSAYPPDIPPVVSEHARRDRRALIDGDLATGVRAPSGSEVVLEMVWPTSLQSAAYFQDIRCLRDAACSAQAVVLDARGKRAAGPVVQMERACRRARRWALWTYPGWAVRLPLPAAEATHVLLHTMDGADGVLSPTEVRVRPRSIRTQ